jgi:hypothetical protein
MLAGSVTPEREFGGAGLTLWPTCGYGSQLGSFCYSM